MNFIRRIITDICIYILRKNEVSVLIGYRVDGKMHALHNYTCLHDSELHVTHYLKDGSRWDIPGRKFYAEREVDYND